LFTSEEAEKYNSLYSRLVDYQSQKLPGVITNGMTEGDAYAKGFEQYEIDEVVEIFAKYAKISNADE